MEEFNLRVRRLLPYHCIHPLRRTRLIASLIRIEYQKSFQQHWNNLKKSNKSVVIGGELNVSH